MHILSSFPLDLLGKEGVLLCWNFALKLYFEWNTGRDFFTNLVGKKKLFFFLLV